jgi:hypothetical protein
MSIDLMPEAAIVFLSQCGCECGLELQLRGTLLPTGVAR